MEAAKRLAAAVAAAERSIDPDRLKKLTSFLGVVRMDGQPR